MTPFKEQNFYVLNLKGLKYAIVFYWNLNDMQFRSNQGSNQIYAKDVKM